MCLTTSDYMWQHAPIVGNGETMSNRALGKRIKEFRLARLWTQGQVAKEMMVSKSTITRLEAGKSVADLTKAKIEKYLALAEAA